MLLMLMLLEIKLMSFKVEGGNGRSAKDGTVAMAVEGGGGGGRRREGRGGKVCVMDAGR